MKKLHEILRLPHCDGDIGLEFEAEGTGMRIVDTDNWKTERDGSLRGTYPEECAEFVLTTPCSVDKVGEVMDELSKKLPGAEFDFSFRTSSHVHVNVQELTADEMLAFLYLVLLFEKPLMSFCGESRQGNRFCLRVADAEGYVEILEALFKRCIYTMLRLDGNEIRYSAVNIHSLKKYGSIEFRGMRGNISKGIMVPWCETLVHLRDYAKKLGSPVNVYNKYIATDTDLLYEECLGKHSKLFKTAECIRDIEQSFSLTIDLPHAFKRKVDEVEDLIVKKRVFDEEPIRMDNADGAFHRRMAGAEYAQARRIVALQWQDRLEARPDLAQMPLQVRLADFLKLYREYFVELGAPVAEDEVYEAEEEDEDDEF